MLTRPSSMELDSASSYRQDMNDWSELSLNLGQLCRICADHSDTLIPIFDGEGLEHRFDVKIHSYLPIQVVREDILPCHICYNCATTLLTWHGLFTNCQEADRKFHHMLGIKDVDESTRRQQSHVAEDMHLCSQDHLERSVKFSIDLKIASENLLSNNAHSERCLLSSTGTGELLPCASLISRPDCQYLLSNTAADSDEVLMSVINPAVPEASQQDKIVKKLVEEHGSSPIKKSFLGKKVCKRTSVLNKKRNSSTDMFAEYMPANCPLPNVEETQKFSNRVSAIQSTSSSIVFLLPDSNSGRSKSVLVRNESVRSSSLPEGDFVSKCDETLVESAVIREHRNVGRIDNLGSGAMVSVVRPTCLRRAPTKVELLENQSQGSVPSLSVDATEHVSQVTISNLRNSVEVDQNSKENEDNIPSPNSSLECDKKMDPSHTCFLCKKFISNKVLLLSHEKSHLNDMDASNKVICKFCSNPQDSISDMHLHYAQHEAELERHQKKDSNRKALLCKQCGQMFTTEERLSAHLRFHADNMESTKHECKTCGETFITRSKLAVHLWSHAVRPSNKTFKCHICGKGFISKSAVMEHRLKHTAEEKSRAFKCVVCGMAFGNNTLLGKHRLTHSKKELARPFKCTFCDKAFARNHTLQIHHLTHSDQKSHLCSKCGKGFKMRNSLIQHLRTHQDPSAWPKYPCNQCGAVFKVKSRLKDHLRLHSGDRPFVCGTCGKQFHKVTALHTHEISHTERRPYMCDMCGKAFKWSKNLRQHKTIHLGLEGVIQSSVSISKLKRKAKCHQPCQCEICGKQLSGRNSLQQHLANIHHQGTPLKRKATMCSICGKILSSSGALGRHIKVIHGGLKAFKCDVCDREYSTKVARDDHYRSHTGERPFTCQSCPKTFTSLSNLHIHRLSHSEDRPHKCTYCDKQFKRRAHLIPHIRTHTGEKPYVCNICNRSFTQSNDLNKHRFTHSDSKEHACDCGMAFRLKRDLKSHVRRYHPVVQTLTAKIDPQLVNCEGKEDSKRILILHSEQSPFLNPTLTHSSYNIPVQVIDPPSVVVRNAEALVTVKECVSTNQPVNRT